MITRRLLLASAVFALPAFTVRPGLSASGTKATLYKNPQCFCCDGHADYLRQNGFEVTEIPTHDLSLLRRKHKVPEPLEGCHTTLVDGYVVEGHVPIDTLNRLLRERPNIVGISLPGMPEGSPGMIGQKTEPFTIYELNSGKVYAVE